MGEEEEKISAGRKIWKRMVVTA